MPDPGGLEELLNSADLYQAKSGPVIIMGNGPSLNDISDEFLAKYPTFGCNTIHLRKGFKPSYWAAADSWVMNWAKEVEELYPDIPKFYMAPTPFEKRQQYYKDGCLVGPGGMAFSPERSERYYAFVRAGGPVELNPKELHPGYLTDPGIAFKGITHAMIQIALFMGHDTFYLVGCDNTGGGQHFYEDKLNDFELDEDLWTWAFNTLQVSLIPRMIVNLSTRGEIKGIPRADWRNL